MGEARPFLRGVGGIGDGGGSAISWRGGHDVWTATLPGVDLLLRATHGAYPPLLSMPWPLMEVIKELNGFETSRSEGGLDGDGDVAKTWLQNDASRGDGGGG